MAVPQQEGFLSALFDFSFQRLVIPRVARWVYGLGVAGTGFLAVLFLVTGLARGGAATFVALVVAPVGFLLACVVLRVWLETLVVLFLIHEAVRELVRHKGSPTP